MKTIIVSMLLIGCVSSAADAQLSRSRNKSSVPYRASYQRMATGFMSSSSFEIRKGRLWAWGENGYGQLGLGGLVTPNDQSIPVQVGTDADWVSVVSGPEHSLALKSNGTLWTWGNNEYGQLGNGIYSSYQYYQPTQVSSDADWVSIAAGYYHSLALKSNGRLYAWGYNDVGQLAVVIPGDIASNTPINIQPAVGQWLAVAVGSTHHIFLKDNGTLWSCGSSNFGQLGLGSTVTQSNTASLIGLDTNWVSVVAGLQHNLALKSDGSLWAWGRNSNGQLGNGNTTDQFTPVKIGTDKDWVSIAGGGGHSLALKSNGQLYAWNYNNTGQLGIGNTTSKNSPQQVGADTNWVSVMAGSNHSLALKSDGSLWVWGGNGNDQLGNTSTDDKEKSPKRLGTDNDWIGIAAGTTHSLALKSSGILYTWGGNYVGQLEIGNV